MKQPIRLTNKTAIALRKNAQRIRTAHYCAAVIISMMMAALAVYFGIKWLPAVPMMVTLCVLLDCAIVLRAKSRYLSLIGQAICTEAAARDIRLEGREKKRKARAVSDLLEAKADIAAPAREEKEQENPFFEQGGTQPFRAVQGETVPVLPIRKAPDEEDAPRRRRRQKSLQLIKSNQAQ